MNRVGRIGSAAFEKYIVANGLCRTVQSYLCLNDDRYISALCLIGLPHLNRFRQLSFDYDNKYLDRIYNPWKKNWRDQICLVIA